MKQSLKLFDSALKPRPKTVPPPTLLVRLEPWHQVFLRNLGDTLFSRGLVELQVSYPPGDFWDDVFVHSRLPWGRFAESVIFHTAVIAVLWGSARLLPRRTPVAIPVAFHSSDVIYYQASEYLPPLNTGDSKPRVAAKGDPAYSPQPVISVPPDADNRKQTIVTPPKLKLNQDLPLPNVVAWNHPAPAIPLSAANRPTSAVKLPALSTAVIAPPPDVEQNKLSKSAMLSESAVAPAPNIDQTASKRALPEAQMAVIAPPPGVELASVRKLSDINIGHAQVVAPAPQLPLQEQHAISGRDRGSLGNPGAAVVPPPPAMPTGNTGGEGRMIALNLQPASATGPIEVPNGNRRGTFAATPHGKPAAAGTPEGTTGSEHAASGNSPTGRGAGAGHSNSAIPPGLFVGAGTAGDSISAAIAGSRGAGGDPPLMASATPPRTGSMHRAPALEERPDQQTNLERKVFANRKSYAMTLNLPNLNSAGGSWVMHFSELKDQTQKGDLLAPVATRTVDPGYPLELMRENIRGMVTLSAVIRSDGSVGDVEVLNGIDDRLDAYARNALMSWKFLPALRNGNPVALQAVVMIPFRPRAKVGF